MVKDFAKVIYNHKTLKKKFKSFPEVKCYAKHDMT